MQPRLSLFNGDDSSLETPKKQPAASTRVSIRLEEAASILADASKMQRSWLADFGDEEVTMSSDLYEILTAYSQLRPSA